MRALPPWKQSILSRVVKLDAPVPPQVVVSSEFDLSGKPQLSGGFVRSSFLPCDLTVPEWEFLEATPRLTARRERLSGSHQSGKIPTQSRSRTRI